MPILNDGLVYPYVVSRNLPDVHLAAKLVPFYK